MSNISEKKIGLIATLPKSGTWYSHTFFWCYETLLKNSEAYSKGLFELDLAAALKERKIVSETTHTETLGIDKLHICHAICPGFEESNDEKFLLWDALSFPVPGFNWGEEYIRERNEWNLLNPSINHNSKIIYLYRNPLDYFISHHRHALNHLDDTQRHKITKNGKRTPINNLHEFIFKFDALGGFIKHYYSYKKMAVKYPKNILMIPYEKLTTNPYDAFKQILAFLTADDKKNIDEALFDHALKMCSKESLMGIENKMKIALANDQKEGEKHIRDGKIGKWQNSLSDQELVSIETALNLFDISLNDFTLSEDESGATRVKRLQIPSNKNSQLEFFENQLNNTSDHKHENRLLKAKISDLENKVVDLNVKLSAAGNEIIPESKTKPISTPLNSLRIVRLKNKILRVLTR